MPASIRLRATGFAECTRIAGGAKPRVATASSIQATTSYPVPADRRLIMVEADLDDATLLKKRDRFLGPVPRVQAGGVDLSSSK